MGIRRLPVGYPEVVVALLFVFACTGSRRGSRDESIEPRSNQSSIREQRLNARPKLVVIEREGHGAAAVAFAAITDGPPIANYGLSLVFRNRLARFGISSEIGPSSFGQSLIVLVHDAEAASSVIDNVWRVLSAEVNASELDRQLLDQLSEKFGTGHFDSPGEIELSRCSGELYRDAHQAEALTNKATLVRWFETTRRQAYSQSQACFSVVGSSRVAFAVRTRLLALPPWPDAVHSESRNAIVQSHPAVSVESSNDWGLSFAWTTGSLGSAIAAWRTLRAQDSSMIAQLSALESEWKVNSISAIARPAGACLRIHLSHPIAASVKVPTDLQSVARVVVGESRIALTRGVSRGPLREYELIGSDPSLTARRAAWQSLSVEQPRELPALQTNLQAPSGRTSELQSALATALSEHRPTTIELRYESEPEEAEQWALLASTCGPSSESVQDSGASAAWFWALARKYSGTQGVALEPWITSDGIGLIAHANRQSSNESHDGVAQRIGNTLGRVLATGKVTALELAMTREETLLRMGALPRRAWSLLLDTLTTRRPSLLEPLGSVSSVRHLDLSDLSMSRRHWMREPTRAAVVTSDSKSQAGVVGAAIARWLEPHLEDDRACEPLDDDSPEQETRVVTYSRDELDASAYVAFRLLQVAEQQAQYGDWLEWLLTRRGGRLETTLVQPGVVQSARAFIRGPRGRKVLLVELHCFDDAATAEAINRVRLLLTEIARTGPSAIELDLAGRWAQEHSIQPSLDPRNRLVKLWLGASALTHPSRAGFPTYLARVLESAPVTIVRVRK